MSLDQRASALTNGAPRIAVPPTTVVIPTFNEAANVDALLAELREALADAPGCEVLFVDDSTDDTPALIERGAAGLPFPVRVIHRERPDGGLGGAVCVGLRESRTPWAVVMDADLQHPPRLAPALAAEGERTGAALVVASRYTREAAAQPGGSGFANPVRVLVSRFATRLVLLLFRGALRGMTDPMSGFFALRRDLWEGRDLRPSGYKILLELAVRTRPTHVAELPYRFQPRHAGDSKAGAAEGLRFLRHLVTLRFSDTKARMLAFGLVGLSGVLPNLGGLWLLMRLGVGYLPAEVAANQAAVVWNFLLLDLVLFHHRRTRHWSGRFWRFSLVANADLLLRIPLLAVLVHGLHWPAVPATGLTLVLAFALRFLITDRAIYVPVRPSAPIEAAPMEVP